MWGMSGPDLCPTWRRFFCFSVSQRQRKDRMSVQSLKCKEWATEYELGAAYFCERCFGPLEVKYDHSGLEAAEAKRRIQAGSRGVLGYGDFLPLEGRPTAGPRRFRGGSGPTPTSSPSRVGRAIRWSRG